MNTFRTFACTALLVSLAACQGNAPSASTAATPQKSSDQGGLVGMVGAAMDQARVGMETKNISIGDGVHININGHQVNAPASNAPHAEITPKGDLLVAGKPIDVNPTQRALLLQYRGEIIGIASAGMEIGKQGVDIAGKAVGTALSSIFHGDSDKAEHELEAQGDRIQAAAMQLCDRLPAMLQTQQQLAAALPAFKPYANMTRSDVEDCRKHDKGNGVAVSSD